MTNKHTPAPWEYIFTKEGTTIVSGKEIICTRVKETTGVGDFDADARLIAAAPDLLDVLTDIMDAGYLDDGYAPTLEKAIAAIKKAKGE